MPYEWLNDKSGNPLAMYRPGEGWVTGQNWSYGEGPGGTQKWGEKELLSRSNLTELANTHYTTGRDAQLANTGQYILGSVGGSSDPYSRSFDPSGVDLSGMTEQQRQLFNPASNWGNAGYNVWGDPNDPNVGRPKAVYNEKPFVKNDSDNFLWNTAKSAFGFDEGGGGVGAGTILAMWLAAGAAGAGAAGAGGADAATAAGAMGGAEGAAAGGYGATGAAGGNWWDSFINSGTNSGISPLEGGGSMPEFDFSDIIEQSGNFTGGESGGNWWTELGLTPADVGMETIGPWTTNPSLEALGGNIGSLVNSTYSELVKKVGEQGAKSVLSKLLSGEASASDYMSLLGKLGATGLGIYGANQQSTALSDLARRYEGYGAPYRAMLEQSYKDPNAFLANSPDIQASVNQGTNSLARSLSRQGNPTGSGAALHELQNYATQGLYGQLGNERNRLANFGGMSSFNAASPGLAGQAIGAQGGALNALGSGISSITNPPTTLEQALNSLNGMSGLKLNSGMGL